MLRVESLDPEFVRHLQKDTKRLVENLLGGGWAFARGTSFASPFWAGLEADRTVGCTSQTGLFNPALYALYSQGSYGSAFTDIKSGDNDLIGGGIGTCLARGAGSEGAHGDSGSDGKRSYADPRLLEYQ